MVLKGFSQTLYIYDCYDRSMICNCQFYHTQIHAYVSHASDIKEFGGGKYIEMQGHLLRLLFIYEFLGSMVYLDGLLPTKQKASFRRTSNSLEKII